MKNLFKYLILIHFIVICAFDVYAKESSVLKVQFQNEEIGLDLNQYEPEVVKTYNDLSPEEQNTFLKKRSKFLGWIAWALTKGEKGIDKTILRGANFRNGKFHKFLINAETDALFSGKDIVANILKVIDRKLVSRPRAFVKTVESGLFITVGGHWALGPGFGSKAKLGGALFFGMAIGQNSKTKRKYIEFTADVEKIDHILFTAIEAGLDLKISKYEASVPLKNIKSMETMITPLGGTLGLGEDYFSKGLMLGAVFPPPPISTVGTYTLNSKRIASFRIEPTLEPIKELLGKLIPFKKLKKPLKVHAGASCGLFF